MRHLQAQAIYQMAFTEEFLDHFWRAHSLKRVILFRAEKMRLVMDPETNG